MSLSRGRGGRARVEGGSADRLRRWLIAGCAALAAMIAAAAATIPAYWQMPPADFDVRGWEQSFLGMVASDRNTAVGMALLLAVLAIPVIHLAVQVVRVGAPARDKRLAAMRLMGARHGDIRRVMSAEAVMCCLPGALVGGGAWLGFLDVAPRLFRLEVAPSMTDETSSQVAVLAGPAAPPSPLLLGPAVLFVPIAAAFLLALTARQVPVGEAAERSTRAPARKRPFVVNFAALVLVAGALYWSTMMLESVGERWRTLVGTTFTMSVLIGCCLVVTTLIAAAPLVASRLGARMSVSDRPDIFLAGHLMHEHPRFASRVAVSLVLLAVAGGLTVVCSGLPESEARGMFHDGGDQVLAGTEGADGSLPMDVLYYTVPAEAAQVIIATWAVIAAIGLLVAASERVSFRGQWVARVVAMGVPRQVLRRALVLEAAAPVALLVTAGLIAGVLAPSALIVSIGNAELLERVVWWRLAALWTLMVGSAAVSAWLGGFALHSAAEPQRIRDRE
ncbi:hypothetical protein LP422_16055 [Janibacter limosus]|uniref:Uncharacterized protein n=1 Tax=Janibacter limosus TaxID=53458 RepID=A0AC61U261_9MICO|nr:FtsX-like permease family protein [Janibacter limosus]UUZ44102.1 hypothetical protein LP422_16055 [Janibacter limosus]